MKPILFFHPANDFTGSTRVLSNVIREEYADRQVTVVTHRNRNRGFLSELPNVKIINVCHPKCKGRSLAVVSSLVWRAHAMWLTLTRGWQYKTFYINTLVPYYAAWVARLYGKPIVWHVHEKFIKRSAAIRLIERVFRSTAAHRIFVSEYLKGQYAESASSTWEVKYNKLSADYLVGVRASRPESRERRRIMMIASLSRIKGVDMFVRLAERVEECDFSLILSADMEQIEEFFRDVTVPDNCRLFPAQADVRPFLQNADLVLNLSNPSLCVETFGMTILEAMPYGIPAIVPNVGGPTELVRHGFNGYCVDVADIDTLAIYVRKALERENYVVLAHNTFRMFEERFA